MKRKGILRVVEATIAVLIVAAALLFIIVRQEATSEETKLSEALRPALNEIAKDAGIRESIIKIDGASEESVESSIETKLASIIPNNKLVFDVAICDCGGEISGCGDCVSAEAHPADSEIYSEERIISAAGGSFNPKIVKVYMWKE